MLLSRREPVLAGKTVPFPLVTSEEEEDPRLWSCRSVRKKEVKKEQEHMLTQQKN